MTDVSGIEADLDVGGSVLTHWQNSSWSWYMSLYTAISIKMLSSKRSMKMPFYTYTLQSKIHSSTTICYILICIIRRNGEIHSRSLMFMRKMHAQIYRENKDELYRNVHWLKSADELQGEIIAEGVGRTSWFNIFKHFFLVIVLARTWTRSFFLLFCGHWTSQARALCKQPREQST